MARVDVRLDHREMGGLLSDDQLRPALRDVADEVAARARASAPVRSGAYRDSIGVEPDTTDRAVMRVVATVPYADVIESRTGNLKRALGGA